jgi:hypothetical protein
MSVSVRFVVKPGRQWHPRRPRAVPSDVENSGQTVCVCVYVCMCVSLASEEA